MSAVGFGAIDAGMISLSVTQSSFCDWSFSGIVAGKIAVTASGDCAVAFGAGAVNGMDKSFNGWDMGKNSGATVAAVGKNYVTAIGVTDFDNGTSSFCDWNFESFSGATISALSDCNATAFGVVHADKATSSFREWHFGKFVDSNVIAAGGSADGFAVGFGAMSCALDVCSSFCGWTFANFEGTTISAASGKGELHSTVAFGAANATGVIDSFDGWHFGEYGSACSFSNCEVRSTATQYATGFGAAIAENVQSSFCDWNFGEIKNGAITVAGRNAIGFGAISAKGAISSFGGWMFDGVDGSKIFAAGKENAIAFGVGMAAEVESSFCHWNLEKFDGATISVSSDGLAVVLGAVGCYGVDSSFDSWHIGDVLNSHMTAATESMTAICCGSNEVADAKLSFNEWHFGAIRNGTVTSCGSGALCSTNFGAAVAAKVISSFNGWNFDEITGVEMASSADKLAVCFGVGGDFSAVTGDDGNDSAPLQSSFCEWHFADFLDVNFSAAAPLAAVFGAGGVANFAANSFNDWHFGNFGETTISVVSGQSELHSAVAFGAAHGGDVENSFSGWELAEIQSGAVSVSGASAVGFGAGVVKNVQSSFCDWSLGGIVDGKVLAEGVDAAGFGATTAGEMSSSFNGWSFGEFNGGVVASRGTNAAIFGAVNAGGALSSFCDWTFAAFDGVGRYCAIADGGTSGMATAFGACYSGGSESSFERWSVEFVGNQTIAALATADVENPQLTIANGIGGWTNVDMAASFCSGESDLDSRPVITIAAAKLSSGFAERDGKLTADLSQTQGNGGGAWSTDDISIGENGDGNSYGWARAIALGENFQLNVGGSTDGERRSGSGGVLNLIGAVTRTAELGAGERRPESTIARIENNWTVNCFGPVQYLRTIDLVSGTLAVVSCANGERGHGWEVFGDAARALESGIAMCHGGKFYGEGQIALNFDDYPVAGRLIVSDGDRLLFHVSESTFAAAFDYEASAAFGDAAIGGGTAAGILCGCRPDGIIDLIGNSQSMICFESGWLFSLEGCDVLPSNILLVLARAQSDVSSDVIWGLELSERGRVGIRDGGGIGFNEDDGVELFIVEDDILGIPDEFSLYWFENSNVNGLALATTRDPILDEPPNEEEPPPQEIPPPWPPFPVGTVALDRARIGHLMRMAPSFDGHGIFCQAFAGVENRRVDPYIRHGLYSSTWGAELGCSGKSQNDRRTLLATAFAAAARSKSTAHVERLYVARRNDLAVAADLRVNGNYFDNLKSYAKAEAFVCAGKMRCRREDDLRNVYECDDFRDIDVHVGVEFRQGFLRDGEAELGCFGEVHCDSIYQYGFVERCGDDIVTHSSMRHRFIATTLGLSVETVRSSRLNLLAKFGWRCEARRTHSRGTASGWDPRETFEQAVFYGERHSATAYLGSRYRMNKNWDVCLDLDGNFARNRVAGSASITFSRHL
ncbi:MAG: hypothetical protein LBB38_03555 [Puniceicoccales bacterium]|nr:hypothetical protein [Puniceicoccales bacterium]